MRALSLYRDHPLGVRIHTALRAWSAPLDAVVGALPAQGSLLDVGCGHGLVANEAALRNPGGRVLGIDVSLGKIRAAQATMGSRPNIEFRATSLEALEESGFDAVALIDVLYLVPAAQWASFLKACVGRLRPGGTFVLKEIATEPRWKFERLKLQEFISTRVVGITQGDTMHFESEDGLKRRLVDSGLSDIQVRRLDAGFASPHVLLTGKRPQPAGATA